MGRHARFCGGSAAGAHSWMAQSREAGDTVCGSAGTHLAQESFSLEREPTDVGGAGPCYGGVTAHDTPCPFELHRAVG
jgi:hypothetical protein